MRRIAQPCLPGRRSRSEKDNTALLAWEKEEECGELQHSLNCTDLSHKRSRKGPPHFQDNLNFFVFSKRVSVAQVSLGPQILWTYCNKN